MSLIKTPFSDRVGLDTVPHRGTGPGTYDSTEVPGGPAREGGLLPELYRDDHWSGPSTSGPLTTPFSDRVGK